VPATPVSSLIPFLPAVELVLIMTVHPGYSGQRFMPETLVKIREVRGALNSISSGAWLEVDGGISPDTLAQTCAAGADSFVSGNYVFKHPQGIAQGIRSLREAAGQGLNKNRGR